MRERILAVLGAVCLIAVGLLVRSQLGGGGSGDGPGKADGSGRPVVACTPDLAAVCASLVAAGRIAPDPPSLDLDQAASPPAGIDAWITWDPAPGIANLDTPDTWTTSEVLGSTPVAILSSSADLAKLRAACEADLTWPCVAHPGLSGLAIGAGDAQSAESLARFYPLAASLVRPGHDFTDLTSSELRAIVQSPANGQAPLADQVRTLLTAPGALNMVVGPRVALETARATPRGSSFVVSSPKPDGTTMTVVLVRRRGGGAVAAKALLGASGTRDALRDAGVTAGAGTLAPADRAGELYSVREKVG